MDPHPHLMIKKLSKRPSLPVLVLDVQQMWADWWRASCSRWLTIRSAGQKEAGLIPGNSVLSLEVVLILMRATVLTFITGIFLDDIDDGLHEYVFAHRAVSTLDLDLHISSVILMRWVGQWFHLCPSIKRNFVFLIKGKLCDWDKNYKKERSKPFQTSLQSETNSNFVSIIIPPLHKSIPVMIQLWGNTVSTCIFRW